MRDAGGTDSTDRWEEGLRILARLIALRIQVAAIGGCRGGSTSSEADGEMRDAAVTETDSEPGLA